MKKDSEAETTSALTRLLGTREIKFRAWDVDNEKMYLQKDLANTNVIGLLYATELVKGKGNIIHMQFTGLKDRNGEDIYEGDIIECDISMHTDGNLPHRGVVVYVNRLCSFATKNEAGETLFVKHLSNTREIIGNVFENPELIK